MQIEDSSKISSWRESFGFYPAEGGKWLVLWKVPGVVAEEIAEGSKPNIKKNLVLILNQDEYEKSRKVLGDWQIQVPNTGKQYNLLINNCVKFVDDVAESLGLKTPTSNFTEPDDYIDAVISFNLPKN